MQGMSSNSSSNDNTVTSDRLGRKLSDGLITRNEYNKLMRIEARAVHMEEELNHWETSLPRSPTNAFGWKREIQACESPKLSWAQPAALPQSDTDGKDGIIRSEYASLVDHVNDQYIDSQLARSGGEGRITGTATSQFGRFKQPSSGSAPRQRQRRSYAHRVMSDESAGRSSSQASSDVSTSF